MSLKINHNLIEKLATASVVFLLISSEILSIPSALRSMINLLSYIIVALLVFKQRQRVAYVLTKDIFLILLVVLACLSVFWSASIAHTQETIRALIRSTFLGIYIASAYTLTEQKSLVIYAASISMVSSIVAALLFPNYGTDITNNLFVWTGIYGHKQYLARFMSIGFCAFLIAFMERNSRKIINLLGLACAFALIILSTSKTGLLMTLFAVFVIPIYYLAKQKYRFRVVILILLTLLTILISFIVAFNIEFIVIDLMGKNLEFNGRLPVWQLAIEKGLEQPLFGYGYAGFWGSEEASEILSLIWGGIDPGIAFHAHSGFVDLFLQLGLVGILLMMANLLTVLYRVIKLLIYKQEIHFFWMFQFLIMMLVVNFSEVSTFLAANNIFWILYVAFCYTSALEMSRLKKQNNSLATTNHKNYQTKSV